MSLLSTGIEWEDNIETKQAIQRTSYCGESGVERNEYQKLPITKLVGISNIGARDIMRSLVTLSLDHMQVKVQQTYTV